MARLPRIVIPGQPMHIVQRGNNRQATFYADEDYQTYLDAVLKALEKYFVDVHAYVLMTNHVHLLLTPHEENSLPRFMQAIGRRYVRYVNAVYRRTGTLWEGRYKSAVIDSRSYLLKCYRYVEMNPVRAKMVTRPDEYRWTSFHSNALGKADEIVRPHALYDGLANTDNLRREAYLSMFANQLSVDDVKAIRSGTTNETVIGNERFGKEIENMLSRRVRRYSHGGDRKSEAYARND